MRYPASEKAEIIHWSSNRTFRPSAHWTSSVSRAPHSIAGMIAASEALERKSLKPDGGQVRCSQIVG